MRPCFPVLTVIALLSAGCASLHPVIAHKPAIPQPRLQPPDTDDDDHETEREDGYLESAEWLRRLRLPEDQTALPLDRYQQARRQIQQMRAFSIPEHRIVEPTTLQPHANTPTAGTWTALGPGNVGGRTRSFLIDPNTPSTLYAGGVTGGVWKSTDSGASWSATFDTLPTVSIGAMAMDPKNSSIIYAGTGESYQGFGGEGIFKTTDGGATWTVLPQTANPAPYSNFYYINRIVVSPNNSSRLYAATGNGVWTSPDAGQTWTKITAIVNYSGCDDLAIRPDQKTDFLFASCTGATYTAPWAIYRNTDAAGTGTWGVVQSATDMGRTALAVAPSQPATIYAVAADNNANSPYNNGLLAVFQSTAGGAAGSWTTQVSNQNSNRLNTAILSAPGSAFADVCSGGKPSYTGQADYDLTIAVDPLDPNRVWVGGIDLFRSDDGGANWGIAMFWEAGPPHAAHADNHALVFPPNYDGVANQSLYSLSDGGIYLTAQARGATATSPKAACYPYNNGISWTSLNNGYAVTQFYHGATYPGAGAYFGGTQDNGTQRGADKPGPNGWAPIFGGDGGDVAIDPVDANTIYYEYVYLSDFQKSSNGGLNGTVSINGITEKSTDFPFITTFTMDPNNSLRLYIGGLTLWRTSDGAQNWSPASGAIPASQGGINAIAVSPSDPNRVVFGTFNGQIYTTTTAVTAHDATAWTASMPRNGVVSGLAFDPVNPLVVYATYSTFNATGTHHVYKSQDGGTTWTAIDGSGATGVPDLPVLTVRVDPRNNTDVYLGTDQGLLISTDGGSTWSHDNDPFPSAMVQDINFDYTGGIGNIVVFTFGRGAWRAPLGGAPPSCSYSVPSTATISAAGGEGSVPVSTSAGCVWSALPGNTSGNFVSPEAPARGIGPASAFFSAPFNPDGVPRQGSFLVEGQQVTVTQPAAVPVSIGASDEIVSAISIATLPYAAYADDRTATSNNSDPVHSCTKSADYKTMWWTFTAPSTGTVTLQGLGARYDTYGDFGLVLAAYPAMNATAGAELACVTVKRGTGFNTTIHTSFSVTQGATYLVEGSASTNDGGYLAMSLSVGATPSSAVTPAAITLMPGQKQQFQAALTNVPNGAVRWTISPELGIIGTDGTYTAPAAVGAAQTVTVTATSLANPAVQSSAIVTLAAPGVGFTAAGVVSAATYQGGGVSPGQIVTIFGTNIGPVMLAGLQLTSTGKIATTTGGTTVFFDGVPAPIIYASYGQLSVVVPYEVAGKTTTQVQVQYNGQMSAPVAVPVVASAPGLFTSLASGSGQAAMLNQDGLVNSSQYGAPPGSFVALYGTGEGLATPVPADGVITSLPLPTTNLPVTVTIGGQPAQVYYAGPAPGLVAGVLQVNVKVPANTPPGNNVPVVVTVGTASSRSDVTMSVLGPDGRTAPVSYYNTGSDTVKVSVFQPSGTLAYSYTIPAGDNYYYSTMPVGSDWGIQVNTNAVRVVSQVCPYTTFSSGPFWNCTGNSAMPFPR